MIDADDTLWENNIYFEQAIHTFIDFLNHSQLSRQEVRLVLDEIERYAGYGSVNFTRSLVETYRRLAEREMCEADLQQIQSFGDRIRSRRLELLDRVTETLAYLAPRHDLVVLTKGDEEEQRVKVARSGLEQFFRQVVVVPEKDVSTYRQVVRDLGADPNRTWMVGNSPRSDINPAVSAGIRAVYIPHPHTWHLEHEEVHHRGGDQVLTLSSFADLRSHF